MKHIMLDLETFGTNPYSLIISIGAVWFDPTKTGDAAIQDEFYVTIDPILSAKMGFASDMDTICWWLQPERAPVYREWYETLHVEPPDAFHGLTEWLRFVTEAARAPDTWMDDIAMWGNGPAFDNEILRNGFKRLNIPVPWRHRNDRCFRTMKNLGGAKELAPPREGVQHNALVDARQQALWLCNIAQKFDLKF